MTESSSLEDSGVLVDNPNDMASSGVLVENPAAAAEAEPPMSPSRNTRRVIHGDQEEQLQEAILEERQKRLQQLAAKQKDKRSTKQQQGRQHPTTNATKPNPFSRFLTAFSVQNDHKRAHIEEWDDNDEEPPLKHPRTAGDDDCEEVEDVFASARLFLADVAEAIKENSAPLLAVGAAVASLALISLIRKRA